MIKEIECKKDDQLVNFPELMAEIDNITLAVEHIVRVNGSSAFPMPELKKKTFWGRFHNPLLPKNMLSVK